MRIPNDVQSVMVARVQPWNLVEWLREEIARDPAYIGQALFGDIAVEGQVESLTVHWRAETNELVFECKFDGE